MPKLRPTTQRWLKTLHLVTVCAWIGGALSLIVVLWTQKPQNGDELASQLFAMRLVDDFIIIPGAMGCLLTGLFYGLWTNWGFFRFPWLTAKWTLTILQILFGTFFLGPWLNTCEDLARTQRGLAWQNPEFQRMFTLNTRWGLIQITLLLAMVILSVHKPRHWKFWS